MAGAIAGQNQHLAIVRERMDGLMFPLNSAFTIQQGRHLPDS